MEIDGSFLGDCFESATKDSTQKKDILFFLVTKFFLARFKLLEMRAQSSNYRIVFLFIYCNVKITDKLIEAMVHTGEMLCLIN